MSLTTPGNLDASTSAAAAGCPASLPGWARLPRATPADRLVAGAVALLAWSALALAATLSTDPRGFGTHEQLGLPQCHFKVMTGQPCPSCGMTTAFTAFVHGELGAALRAQLLGTLLAAATLLAALGGTLMALTAIHLGPVLSGIFIGRNEWLYVLAALALGSWGLKAWTGW